MRIGTGKPSCVGKGATGLAATQGTVAGGAMPGGISAPSEARCTPPRCLRPVPRHSPHSLHTQGECRANPVYMIGKGGAVAQCARACATCTRPAPSLPAFLLGAAEPARAQEAAREAARLGQASLVRGGCLAREACGRLQGGDAEAALLEALQAPAVPAGRPGGGGRASQALASECV